MQNLIFMRNEELFILTKKQLMEDGQMLNADDIAKMFYCAKTKAYSIIRAIKAESDIFGIPGKVHVLDYKIYLENVVARGKGYQPNIPTLQNQCEIG